VKPPLGTKPALLIRKDNASRKSGRQCNNTVTQAATHHRGGNSLPLHRPQAAVIFHHQRLKGILMSPIAISKSASLVPAHVNFQSSGHKKGLAGDAISGAGSIGQLPVGAGQNLFSNVLQSLQQAVSAQASAAASAPATTHLPVKTRP
jgi:hypothetical protein